MTLGADQYHWLKRILESSGARFKFIFIHNLVGGADRNNPGGIEAVPFHEVGGLRPGNNVRYCVPHTLAPGREHTLYMRCKEPMRPCVIQVGDLVQRKLGFVVPAEMIMFKIKPDLLDRFHGDSLRIDIHPVNG